MYSNLAQLDIGSDFLLNPFWGTNEVLYGKGVKLAPVQAHRVHIWLKLQPVYLQLTAGSTRSLSRTAIASSYCNLLFDIPKIHIPNLEIALPIL